MGRLMTAELLEVKDHWTMHRVLAHVRKVGRDSEGHLIDAFRVRELLLAQPEATIASLMNCQFVSLKANDTESHAVECCRRYGRSVLPVTDIRNLLLGVVTVDDALDVAEGTSTREILKFEALDELYVATPIRRPPL